LRLDFVYATLAMLILFSNVMPGRLHLERTTSKMF